VDGKEHEAKVDFINRVRDEGRRVDGERWGGTERSALGTSNNQLKLKSKHFIIVKTLYNLI
jgi:hypothetical protein